MGILLKKVVPADNSCLFTSIGFVLKGEVDTENNSYMRAIIAEEVANDSETYNEAILGKPNREYCDWIKRSESWGGAIEVSILSNFYGIEIDVVDITNAIINRFGEDKNFGMRVFLLFDGIHYDPLYMESISVNKKKLLYYKIRKLKKNPILFSRVENQKQFFLLKQKMSINKLSK